MTTLLDLVPAPTLDHGLIVEEPKRTFLGWSLLAGKNCALGLATYGARNASFQLGYYEEMADVAFVVERMNRG